MQSNAKFLGMVRVWKDGDEWKWAPIGKWAAEGAITAKRYRGPDGDVIYVEHGDNGEYIRGAVKAN